MAEFFVERTRPKIWDKVLIIVIVLLGVVMYNLPEDDKKQKVGPNNRSIDTME